MTTLSTNIAQGLSEEVGPLLSHEVLRHTPALLSFYELHALMLDNPSFVPKVRTESLGTMVIKVYARGRGELQVTSPGGIGVPQIVAPVVEMVDSEVVEFSGQEVAIVERPVWLETSGMPSPVVVSYQSEFFGARTGTSVAVREVSPGVFALPEPGFGTLTVSYPTRAYIVTLDYDPLPSVLGDAQRNTLARNIVQTSGVVPDYALPMLYVRLSYELGRPDRDPLQFTALVKDRMKLSAYPVRWTIGQANTNPEGEPTESNEQSLPPIVLVELSRKTVNRKITSSTNPAQFVEVQVVSSIELKNEATGRRWQLRLNEA